MLTCLVLILATLVLSTQGSCPNPVRLGLENGRVQDSQLSVSSYIGKYNLQIAARLNLPGIPKVFGGSWRADNDDRNPWIQVDFLRPVTVTGIITQGRSGSDQWVTTYKLAHSDDGITWTNDGTLFKGNVDQDTLKENTLVTPKTHRFFRVLPKKFYRYCSMRLEFVGCITGCRDNAPLGLENGFLHNSQMTTSSFGNVQNRPDTARLFDNKGWLRNPTDTKPWLQVDFIAKVIVDEVQTQGCGDVISWIKTYKLLYGDNGYDFVEFSENDVPKVFNGNTDSSTVVGNKITTTAARYFRIKPLECETDCGLRAEFIGCYQDCTSPVALGLENGIIKDIQLKATSSSSGYSQQYGRLNYNDVFSGWLHDNSDTDPWFEVNLLKDALISSVATQGGDQNTDKWMETFEMSYSINGKFFLFYKFANKTKVFKANYDHSSVVKHNLPSTIYASVIRLHPKTCNLACVMRAEIYGCFDGIDNCASIACQSNGNCTDLWDSFKCECPSGYHGYLCDLSCSSVIDLGLGDGSISNLQFTASSVYDENYPPGNVRLDNTENFWRPLLTDDKLWVQVDFQETVIIAIIKTRGLEHLDRFIMTFSISYGDDGLTFQDHQDGARTKIFKANTDSNTTVLNYFTPNINSRYLRIHVISFYVRAFFKMELASCMPPCTVVPAGMESTEIRDNQITASSNYNVYYRDIYARLKHTTAYWTPANSDYNNPWLQVDFMSSVIIDGIDTQGGGAASWIKTYTVSYGNDGITFDVYKQNNLEKVFTGNTDSSTVVHNVFDPRITSRFVRVNPKTHTYYINLRIELYVCNRACMPTNPCLNNGGCTSLTPTTFGCSCVTNVQGDICETCSDPIALGLQSGAILDSQLTSSSVDSNGLNNAKFARLEQTAVTEVTSGGWAPKSDDLLNPWLQIDFRMNTTLSHLKVQGANDSTQNTRVTKFKIAYSHDGVTFLDFKEDEVVRQFATTGGTNGNEILRREFKTLLIARYVRFLPLEWNDYPVTRLEMYGCTGVHLCLINPCLNSGTCLQTDDTSYQCDCAQGFSGQHCEIEQTLCTESSCSNGGNCTVENGTLVCRCPESFLGATCETSCPRVFSVGLAYGKIPKSQFTASSQSSPEFAPKEAHLNSDGWMPATEDPNPWIMIQLDHDTTVVGIATEGSTVEGDPFYTRTYTISYGRNGVSFTDYMENGVVKIFVGNYNGSGIVRNDFVVNALYVRVHPKTCLGICRLKIELYSCENPCDSYRECLNGANCSVDGKDLPYCDCLTNFFGDSCEFCSYSVSLGVENGNISDAHFNASSERDQLSLAKYGRLNNVYEENVKIGCWVPLSTDTEPWLQVKFNAKVTVHKVTTQGDPSSDGWVTSYEIHYSGNNGATFVVHKDVLRVINSYTGNSDRDTVVTRDVTPAIYTQFIRIYPATWNGHVGLRVEFHGCKGKNYCLNNPCLNHGSCSTSNYGFACFCRGYYTGVACQTYRPPPPPPPRPPPSSPPAAPPPSSPPAAPSPSSPPAAPPPSSPPAAPPPSSPPVAPPPSSPPVAPPPSSPPAAPPPSSPPVAPPPSSPPVAPPPSSPPAAPPPSSPPPSSPLPSTTPPSLLTPSSPPDAPPTSLPTAPPPSLSSSSPPLLSSTNPPPTPGYATIAGFALNPIPAQEFGQRFSVVWQMTSGTNVSVTVAYNGIPCCNAGPLTNTGGHCDCLVTDTGLFDHDGMVNISVAALNLVSRKSAHIQMEVLRIITRASLTMLTSYSNFGTELEGRGSQRNVFPAEYPVKFNFSYQGGPVTNVYWTFICEVDGNFHESQLFFDKLFPSQTSQSCQIMLKLENNINSTIVLGSIMLQESVILNSITSNGPVKENQTITFTISLVKLGSQTCMWVDLGDNTSLRVFGVPSCATQVDVIQINPKILSQPRMKFFLKSANTQQIVINHVYLHPGFYHVRLNASNEVSMVTQEIVAVVLPYVCHQPNVTITGLSSNTSNILNAAHIYRSMAIALSTKQAIDCEKTGKTKTKWSIFKLDDDPSILHMVPVSSLKKTAYHSDVSTLDLLVPGNELPYGFFEITARLEMNGLPDVYGNDVIYIQVIQTPWLEAAVVGGSFHTAPFGLMGVLNSSASADPDFPDTDSGMSFVWYCRDATDHEFIASNLTYEPLVSSSDPVTLPVNASRGCFGSGRGRIDTANSTLYLDTKKMIEDKTYVILLVVSKIHPEFGLRQAMTTVFFHVENGFPPKLDTSCSKNCQDKIINSEKTILQSNCSAFCAGELTFGWSLYMYDDMNTPQPLNLSALHEIPPKQFQEMVYNPINELDLAIKPYSLQCGKKYTLAFRASRPTGVIGELRTTLLVNSPPAGGTCNVLPLSGIALSTNFTFTCDGWADPESPLTYEFSYGNNETETLFYYRTIASDTPISHTDWLPVGEKSSNYTFIVKIVVKDSYGSLSNEQFIIQVLPPSNEQQNLTMLTNSITEHFKTGDILASLSLLSALSSTLNTLGSGTSNVSDATRQKTLEQMREDMLTLLSEVKPQDISAVMQVSGSLRLLVKEPDQLTSKARDSALTITEFATEKLKNLTKEDEGFHNIKSGVTNMLGSLGSLNSASSEDSGSHNKTITASNVHRTVDVLGQLHDILLDYLVPNEGPTAIMTETLSVSVERVTANDLGKKENTLKKCRFKPPTGAAFGIGDILSNPNNSFLQMQPVDIKLALFDKNPFTWDTSSQNVTSNIIDIVVGSKHLNVSTSELTEDIAVTIPRDPLQFLDSNNSFYLKPHEMNSSSETREYTKFHCFTRLSNYTAMNFEIKPKEMGIHLNVFLKKSGKPDSKTGDYDFSYELPDFSTCKVGNDTVYMSHELQSSSHEAIYVDPTNCTKDPYTVFVSNIDFNGTGEYCFAVQHTEQFHNETFPDPMSTFSSRNRRSVSCEVGARRVRRSCVIIPPAPPKPTDPSNVKVLVADNLGFDGKYFSPNQTPNYNLTMFESSCIFWDVVNETWKGEGCRVAVGTNRKQIVCYCNHLTSFGSDLLVAPNPIDFDSVFQNFGSLAENVAVLALISTILGFYIIGVVWARRADQRDLLMTGPTIIKKAKGSYCYLITSSTGSRQGAGTSARVVFTMTGDQNETVAVRLRDKERPCFERGQTNSFVVTYPNGVGDLSYVTIWHDNSGSSPSWYLSRLTVKDLQTGKTWRLVCENWLAVESDDGKVCRILPVANEQELTNFNHVFSKKALTGLADGHIWFSIVSRPPTSNFTRVQRLSCALCLLCCTMITSAMFYNMGGQGPSPFTLHIGSLVIDLKPFVIGLQSSIIIVPVNVLIVQIFRNLREKKGKPQRTAVYEVEKDGDGGKKNENIGRIDEDVVDGIQIENQKPSKGKLPHWFTYIAYAICYLASAASIFFTLLYSIQWGKETSTEWVIAMVTSFFQSVLLLQPIKVVLAAVVFALCIKKASESEEQYNEGLMIKKPNQEQKVDNLAELEKKMQSISKRPRKLKRYYSPPDPIRLRKAREKRLKDLKMNAALKEIFAFFFFLILLMDVAQYHRNPNTFLLTKTLYETFETVDAYGIDLSAISDADSLWMWTRETLIPGLYANEWYNGKKIEKGWLGNIEDYLVGIPRVRLLRVKEDSCRVSNYFKDTISHCYSGYSVANEEDGTFPVGWKPLSDGNSRKRRDIAGPETENEWAKYLIGGEKVEYDQVQSRYKRGLDPIMGGQSGKNRRKKKRLLASAKPRQYVVNDNALLPDGRVLSCFERWHHQTMIDLRGFPYWGTITMYSGSGYVANLGYDHVTAYTVVADLHSNGWIDVQTRAVFVEFTVYNANTNLFGILSYFIEFSPSSEVVTTAQYQVARFYLHLTGGQTLAHVLVIFFMLYFLYREGKLVYKQRLAYFKGFWNWVEVILIVCELLLIVLFLARLYEVDRNLLQLQENPNDYVGFQYAANADALMTYVIGVLVFFYILRFLRLLRFNKNFLVIGKTLQRISSPILSFCLPFIAGFLAFGLLAFAIFGSELEDYSSIIRALVTQFSMTLGDFDFDAIFTVNPMVATLYFFSFIGLNVMVLMNMFIAIINDSYAEVQEETAEMENELEILDYVTTKITHSFYETFYRGKVARVKETKPQYKKKSKKKPAYKPTYLNKTYTELDLRVEKLDLFVDIIQKSIDADKLEQKRFCSVPKENRQDLFFRVLCLMESILEDDEENVKDYENDE